MFGYAFQHRIRGQFIYVAGWSREWARHFAFWPPSRAIAARQRPPRPQPDNDPHVVSPSKRDSDTSYFSYHMGHVFQTDSYTAIAYGTRVRAASSCHGGCQLDPTGIFVPAPDRRPSVGPGAGGSPPVLPRQATRRVVYNRAPSIS
jgi:hypothetical protein